MNLDDMKILLTIARTGSLTSAAKALYVSQPALSKRLSQFEREIGTSLFVRGQGTRRLTLTPAGRMLIPFAERWDDLQQEIGMLHDLNSRVHFFVNAVDSLGECILPEAVYRFHQEHPDTELVAERHHSRSCYASVHDRTADIAFVVQELFYQNIVTTPLFQERMLLLTGPGSAFPDAAETAALDPEKEIVVPWNSEFMRWRQDHLRFSLHPGVSLWTPSMAVPFLAKNGAWLIAPQTAADHTLSLHPEIRCVPLADPPPDRTVYWVEEYGRHHSASDHLLEILRQQLKDRPGIRWLYSPS